MRRFFRLLFISGVASVLLGAVIAGGAGLVGRIFRREREVVELDNLHAQETVDALRPR